MSTVNKSFNEKVDPVIDYCNRHTVKLHPLQIELQAQTLNHADGAVMLGAPEVLTVGQHFIKLIRGKKVIDVGTFTGASALAWALALPDDGKVFTLDVNHQNYKKHGLPIISKCPKTLGKIIAVEDKQITEGRCGTFDFAFIDADSLNGSTYYDRCVQLLRSGGVIVVDNALWSGKVVNYSEEDTRTKLIDERNNVVSSDPRTNSFLVNSGDGMHVAFKI